MKRNDRLRLAACAALVTLAPVAAAWAQEDAGVLLHDEAGATVALDGQRHLDVSGLGGTLVFREGRPGELRYEARVRDNRREEFAVGLWADGSTLRLGPLDGQDASAVLLEVAVPPEVATRVEASHSLVHASALAGAFELHGEELELQARAARGPMTVDVAGGTILVDGSEDELDLAGRSLQVTLRNTVGPILLDLQKSTLSLLRVQGAVEGVLEDTTVEGSDVPAPLRLDVERGSVDCLACAGGGDLDLREAPLVLRDSQGPLEVRSDTKVTFEGHAGGMKIEGYGAAVTGQRVSGPLEVETDNAPVELSGLDGETTLRGHALELQVENIRGTLSVSSAASHVVIRHCDAALTVESDFGDVEIDEASQPTQVTSRNGAVRITGFRGTLTLSADGPSVDVAWIAFSLPELSQVDNASGDVYIRVPATTSLMIEAEAPYGRIESELPGVEVSDDGHYATAETFRARQTPHIKKATVQARSGGDIYLSASSGE